MTWLDHQHRSKKLTVAARMSVREGDETKARELYAEAARAAEQAMSQVPRERQVTLGVIAMFAASLWRRAHRTDEAARLAKLVRDAPDLFPITVTHLSGTKSQAKRD